MDARVCDPAQVRAARQLYDELSTEETAWPKYAASSAKSAAAVPKPDFRDINIEVLRTGETLFVRVSESSGPGLFAHAAKHTLTREVLFEMLNHANADETAHACCRQVVETLFEQFDTPLILNLCVPENRYGDPLFVQYCAGTIRRELEAL